MPRAVRRRRPTDSMRRLGASNSLFEKTVARLQQNCHTAVMQLPRYLVLYHIRMYDAIVFPLFICTKSA